MSRVYEAKEAALDAYPDDRGKAVDLFLQFINIDECDFDYEYGMSIEEYLYGKVEE